MKNTTLKTSIVAGMLVFKLITKANEHLPRTPLYYFQDHTQPHPIIVFYTNTHIVPMSLKVYWHISSRPYVSMYVLHQMHVAIQPDACIHNYFQTRIMHIFCINQFQPPNTRTCIPQGIVQPKLLCATEQDDFLDQKCFKDCEGWQKRSTFVRNNLIP